MQVERNPYDPIEIKMPNFGQMVKAGMAFTLGAVIMTFAATSAYFLIMGTLATAYLRSLGH